MTDLTRPVTPPGRGSEACPPERHSNIRRIRKEGQR